MLFTKLQCLLILCFYLVFKLQFSRCLLVWWWQKFSLVVLRQSCMESNQFGIIYSVLLILFSHLIKKIITIRNRHNSLTISWRNERNYLTFCPFWLVKGRGKYRGLSLTHHYTRQKNKIFSSELSISLDEHACFRDSLRCLYLNIDLASLIFHLRVSPPKINVCEISSADALVFYLALS